MRKIQKVVRTYPKGYTNPTSMLDKVLAQGYIIVAVNPIGECLEYIVEKEVTQ